MTQPQEEYITEATAMLGAGYERQVVQFENPSETLVETEAGYEVVRSLGWIKLSSHFREKMLAELKGAKLGVFICVCLHLNNRGESFPGIDTIARETGYNRDTVMQAITEMEAIPNLLSVLRRRGRPNIYSPLFVSRGTAEPVVKIRLVGKQPVQKTPTTFPLTSPEKYDSKKIKRVKDEIYSAGSGFSQATSKLTTLRGGALNSIDVDYLNTWTERHTDEWIGKAIDAAQAKGARSSAYVDRILIGWEANGYPKTREQLIQERKGKPTNGTHQPKPTTTPHTDADRAIAARIRAQRQAAREAADMQQLQPGIL